MKSLNEAGVSFSGRWARWGSCLMFAAVVVGCGGGGGADPLGVTDDGGSGGTQSSGVSEARLLEAYDRLTCGMRIEDVERLVGAKAEPNSANWRWYESLSENKAELSVVAATGRPDPNNNPYGFPADGIARAHYVWFSNESRGYFIDRALCPTR